MSISGISSDPTVSQNYASSPFQQVRKDFVALGKALGSGSLSDAQSAFATLQSDLQAAGQALGGQQAGVTSQLSTDLAAVGTALNSGPGSLSDAQKAFATLQSDLKAAGQALGGQQMQKTHHHHHHHHGGGAQNTQNTQSTTSNPFSDLATLGSALQSNDLTGAQNAFATLMQDLQNTVATLGNGTSQAVGTNVNVAT